MKGKKVKINENAIFDPNKKTEGVVIEVIEDNGLTTIVVEFSKNLVGYYDLADVIFEKSERF